MAALDAQISWERSWEIRAPNERGDWLCDEDGAVGELDAHAVEWRMPADGPVHGGISTRASDLGTADRATQAMESRLAPGVAACLEASLNLSEYGGWTPGAGVEVIGDDIDTTPRGATRIVLVRGPTGATAVCAWRQHGRYVFQATAFTDDGDLDQADGRYLLAAMVANVGG